MSEQVTQDHRLLKAVVIGLGAALVAGFGLLIWGLVSQGSRLGSAKPAPLVLPQGAEITQMAASDRLLALKIKGPGTDEILLIDPRSSAVMRRIPIQYEERRP